jgi:hypothetical protein
MLNILEMTASALFASVGVARRAWCSRATSCRVIYRYPLLAECGQHDVIEEPAIFLRSRGFALRLDMLGKEAFREVRNGRRRLCRRSGDRRVLAVRNKP